MGDIRYVWVPKELEDYTDYDYLLPFVPLVRKEVYGPHGGKRDRLAKHVWRVHENKAEEKLRKMLRGLDTTV